MLSDRFEPGLFGEDPEEADWEPTDDELACALELNTLNTFRGNFRRLRTSFRSFRAMYEAPVEALSAFSDWSPGRRGLFIEQRGRLRIGRELKRVPEDVVIITYFDSRYPSALRDLYAPPPVLHVRGDLEYDFSASLAIVGSRTFSDYGRQTAEHFAYQLASWGFTIISGGARGIDSIAHGSVLAGGGKTIAVFGCGIDVVFPAENKKLFERIGETGALISEFPLGTIPEKYNFPARNRIIAALGRGTLVVEAGEKSGALITADLALQNNREVFAVPGRLTDGRSRGTNMLVHDGAQLALEPSDIPLRFGLIVVGGGAPDSDKAAEQLTGDEAIVYDAVSLEAREADVLVREIGLPAPRVLAALLILQTKGLVRELPGSRFVRPVGPMVDSREPGPEEKAGQQEGSGCGADGKHLARSKDI